MTQATYAWLPVLTVLWWWASIVRAVLDGCRAAAVQKDTGVLDLPQAAVLIVLAVPPQDVPGMHPRLGGLSHGRNSPWAVIVAYVVLVDHVQRLDLRCRRGECERAHPPLK